MSPAQQQQQPRRPGPRYLFGGDRPWDAGEWTASDDRVRGGRSRSALAAGAGGRTATFSGHLDTAALGGAGFASQRTLGAAPAWDLAGRDALVLDVARADGREYALTLKDTVLPPGPGGREQSTVSWEHRLAPPAGAGARVVLRLADFRPTYRGRPRPDAAPLDVAHVRRVGFMMRSFFGAQEGDFSLTVRSLAAVSVGDAQAAETEGGAGEQSAPAEGSGRVSGLRNGGGE